MIQQRADDPLLLVASLTHKLRLHMTTPLADFKDRTTHKTHLGEALLEVVVQHVRLLGHDRQRDVIAHAERALLSGLRHISNLSQVESKVYRMEFRSSNRQCVSLKKHSSGGKKHRLSGSTPTATVLRALIESHQKQQNATAVQFEHYIHTEHEENTSVKIDNNLLSGGV